MARVMRALWPGLRLGWIPIALALLAHVPGRRVFAANEALHGRPGWQFFCAGLVADLLYVTPLVMLAFIVPPLLGAALRRTSAARRIEAAVSGVARLRGASHVASSALAWALLLCAWVF